MLSIMKECSDYTFQALQYANNYLTIDDVGTTINENWLLVIIAVSILAGFVNWYSGYKGDGFKKFNFIELIGETAICLFTVTVTFLLIVSCGYPLIFAVALSGFAGHMSTRFLFLIEKKMYEKVEYILDTKDKDDNR